MNGTSEHYVKQNKPGSERQISHVFSHIQNLDLKHDMDVKEGMYLEWQAGERKMKGEAAEGSECDWSTLHACIKIKQLNPFKIFLNG
jgi:hypothetical protein